MRPTHDPDSSTLLAYLTGDRPPAVILAIRRWLRADPAAARELAALETAQRHLGDDLDPLRDDDRVEAWSLLTHRLGLAAPVRDDASATLAPAKRRSVTPHMTRPWYRNPSRLAVMAGAAIVVGFATTAGVRMSRTAPDVTDDALAKVVSTTVGQRANITLPDGTQLTLAPQSQVRYHPDFGRNGRRDIRLDGEAHFNVVHAAGTPFTVVTATSNTDVLGTAFTVRAYPTDSVAQVVVTDGKVALRPRGAARGTGTTLVRGDLGQLSAAGLATIARGVDVSRYTGWINGTLTFGQTPLRAVIVDLERWYDVKIVLHDPALGAEPLVGTLPTSSADDAIARIAAVLHLVAIRDHNVITLSRKTL